MEERQTLNTRCIFADRIAIALRLQTSRQRDRLCQSSFFPVLGKAPVLFINLKAKIHRGFKVCMMRCGISAANMRMRRRMEQRCHF